MQQKEEEETTTTATSTTTKEEETLNLTLNELERLIGDCLGPPNPLSSFNNNSSKSKSCFSTLLLDYGEVILSDWAVIVRHHAEKEDKQQQHQNAAAQQFEARLYLCSKSLVLEPMEHSLRGLLRCPFAFMMDCPTMDSSSSTDNGANKNNHSESLFEFPLAISRFTTRKYFSMKQNAKIGPHVPISIPTLFRITFLHSSSPTLYIDWCRLLYSSNNNTANRNSNKNLLTTLLNPSNNRRHYIQNNNNNTEHKQSFHGWWLTPLQQQSATWIITLDETFILQPIYHFILEDPQHFLQQQQREEEEDYDNDNVSTDNGPQQQGEEQQQHTSASPTLTWNLVDFIAYSRRYHGLKDTALELYSKPKSTSTSTTGLRNNNHYSSATTTSSSYSSSILLAFHSTRDREAFISTLLSFTTTNQQQQNQNQSNYYSRRSNNRQQQQQRRRIYCLTDSSFCQLALRYWLQPISNNNNSDRKNKRNRQRLSNYHYLCVLNSAAGRTFQDLSRYPVFPWVLQDYTSPTLDLDDPNIYRDLSKPMGAINPNRLEYFQQRYQGMLQQQQFFQDNHMNDEDDDEDDEEQLKSIASIEDTPFLYGTHYSAPGYILYYLARTMPEHLIYLQNGKFDAPDRMFSSIAQCFASALQNHADVKECIPEFYSHPSRGDFLMNVFNLDLGVTQRGERVHDVVLPPWAKDSPKRCIAQLRKALESNHTTFHLPAWLDLVFGPTSRGQGAAETNNLFHPMAYLEPHQLRGLSRRDQNQAELHATEFGIVPRQLYTTLHPTHIVNDNTTTTIQRRPTSLPERNEFWTQTQLKEQQYLLQQREQREQQQQPDTWELLECPSTTNNRSRTNTADTPINRSRANTADTLTSIGSAATMKIKAVVGGFVGSNINPAASNNNNTTSALKETQSWRHNHNISTSNSSSNESYRVIAHPNQLVVAESSSSLSLQQQAPPPPNNEQQHATPQQSNSQQRSIPLSGSGEVVNKSYFASSIFGSAPQTPSPSKSTGIENKNNNVATASDNATASGWDIKVLERKKVHSDAVTGCSLQPNHHQQQEQEQQLNGDYYLTSTSLDGSLKVHQVYWKNYISNNHNKSTSTLSNELRRGFTTSLSRFPYIAAGLSAGTTSSQQQQDQEGFSSRLKPFRTYNASDPLACLVCIRDDENDDNNENNSGNGLVVFCGGHDDVVLAYGITSACAVASLYSHRDAVTGLDVIPRRAKTTSHVMVSGSWDATVKVWSIAVQPNETVSIHREPIAELFDADSTITSLSAAATTPFSLVICTGCSDGSFVVWQCHEDETKVVIHKEPPRRGSGPCLAVKWARVKSNGEEVLCLFCGFANGRLVSHRFSTNPSSTLVKVGAVSVGVGVKCLEYYGQSLSSNCFLLAGCADGALRLLPLVGGMVFTGKPTLWTRLHAPSGGYGAGNASAITCISLLFQEGDEFLCATGAENGSVAVFELKRA